MLKRKFDLVHCKKGNRLIAYSSSIPKASLISGLLPAERHPSNGSRITATQERSISTFYLHLFFLLRIAANSLASFCVCSSCPSNVVTTTGFVSLGNLMAYEESYPGNGICSSYHNVEGLEYIRLQLLS
jgi:hypothetical protein